MRPPSHIRLFLPLIPVLGLAGCVLFTALAWSSLFLLIDKLKYLFMIFLFGLFSALWLWIACSEERFNRIKQGRLHGGAWIVLFIVIESFCLFVLFISGTSFTSLFYGLIFTTAVNAVFFLLIFSSANREAGATLKKGLLLYASSVFCLVILEAVFRLFLAAYTSPTNLNEFSEQIASDWPRPVPQTKPPGIYRILGLSDSFGRIGGNENYHYILEQLLNGGETRADVVNFSMYEYDPPDELDLLQRFGKAYDYDMVLHGFFIGNDFTVPKGLIIKFKGVSARLIRGPAALLPHNFIIFTWAYRYVIMLSDRRSKRRESAGAQRNGSFSEKEFLRVERKRLVVCRKHPDLSDRWKRTVSVLDKLINTVHRAGAQYVMLIHPDQFQVEKGLYAKLRSTYNIDAGLYDLEQPQKFLMDYCRSRNVPCLNLLPVFKERGEEGGLFMKRDTHYNIEGNRLAGETVARFLMQNVLNDE